jgi:hypothetical protein
MRGVTIANVPHGLNTEHNGEWIRSFYIRELNGYDEEFLNRLALDYPTPIKTTELLTRLIVCGLSYSNENTLSKCVKIDRELINELTIGDRISLLLQLRSHILGDKIQCEVICPECNNLMSLDLRVSDILQPQERNPRAQYRTHIEGFNLQIRPVNGKDQESLLMLDSKQDILQYEDYIIRKCLVSAKPSLPKNISPELVAKTSLKLDKIDPQAHLVLDLTCPSCNSLFQTPFIHEDFIFQEIFSRYHLMHQEIHLLAYYYHWKEKEILGLPTTTRKKYAESILQFITVGESIT